MTRGYRAIRWNAQQGLYDGLVVLLVILGAAAFVTVSLAISPQFSAGQMLLRASAFLVLFLLQVLLCIGPLARLSPRFLPLLYNRRHLGVAVFGLAGLHGATALISNFGGITPAAAARVFTSYAHEYGAAFADLAALRHIPFEPFGAIALLLIGLLAATSHDFWPRFLGLRAWKSIHLLVYPAYGLILLHVAFGLLQSESHLAYPLLVGAGAVLVFGIHLAAAMFGPPQHGSRAVGAPADDGFQPVCHVSDLEEGEGRTAQIGRHPIAVFRHAGRAYAMAGVCPHQGGPLGEGRIIDGTVICPWHGRQFHLEDGRSHFEDCPGIPTYPVRVEGDRVFVHPVPHQPDAKATGVLLSGGAIRVSPEKLRAAEARFYVGRRGFQSESEQRFMGYIAGVLLVLAPLYMAAAAAAQSPPGAGAHERGTTYTYTGVYSASPLPSVYVLPSGAADVEGHTGYPMLVTGPGGTPLPAAWDVADGMTVRFEATPIYRSEVVLLELRDDAAPENLGPPAPGALPPPAQGPRAVTLTGELVDARCYLGAHRPGTGKLHRACAIRGLSQGSPPAIKVQTDERESIVLLVAPEGRSLESIVPYGGREVVVRGNAFRTSGFLYITADSVELSRR